MFYVCVCVCLLYTMPKQANKKKSLSQNFHLLKLVSLLPDKERDALVSSLDHSKCLSSIYECVHQSLINSTLDGKWRQDLKTRLEPQKEIFRQLRLDIKKISKKKRKAALIQTGGNLSFILKGVLPLLKEYINSKKET